MSYIFSLLFENTNLALAQDTQTDLGASKFIFFLLSSYDPKHLLNQTFYYLFVCFWGLKSVWFTLISPRLHLCFSRYIITNVIISRPNAGKMSWKDIILPTKDFHLFLKKKKHKQEKCKGAIKCWRCWERKVSGCITAENEKYPNVSPAGILIWPSSFDGCWSLPSARPPKPSTFNQDQCPDSVKYAGTMSKTAVVCLLKWPSPFPF